jgi:TRAP transporter TAXI family solute receptor
LRKDLGGLFLVLALACGCGRGAGGDCQTRFLSIGTGGTGGVYYPYGGALARLISEELPCVQATAEVTGASVDNLKLLQQGKVDLAFTLADTLAEAAAGTGPFAATGAVGDARVVAVLYTNYTHVVVRRDSGIRRVADLRGKVVSVGSPGSDGRKDVTRHGLGVSESAGAMKDRKLDAFFWSGGLPTAAVEDLAATPGLAIDLLPQDDLLPALQAGARGGLYRLAVIPAGAYRGVDRETPTIGVTNLLAASAALDDGLVRDIARILFDRRAALVAAHPEASHLEPVRDPAGLPAPLHPGAMEYYRAAGAVR